MLAFVLAVGIFWYAMHVILAPGVVRASTVSLSKRARHVSNSSPRLIAAARLQVVAVVVVVGVEYNEKSETVPLQSDAFHRLLSIRVAATL